MSILDRYLARSFLMNYAILLAVGIGLYVVIDLLINLDEFTEDASMPFGAVLRTMADYYGNNLALYFSQLTGPAMAMAAAFTVAMLLRNNELVALVSAGVPLQRLAAPILICSVVLVGAWAANQELLIPKLAHNIARSHDDITGEATEGVSCARDANNAILIARRFTPRDGVLHGVYIIEPAQDDRTRNLVQADFAEYDPQRKTWRLTRGVRLRTGGAGERGLGRQIAREEVKEYPFTLSPEEIVLRQASQWAALLSVRQMNVLVHSGGLANLPAIVMSRHVRLTQPLLQWILLTLALPFFLTREPVGVLATGGKSLLLAGLFFGVTFVCHGIISESMAALVAWFPILVFGPVAVHRLANVKT